MKVFKETISWIAILFILVACQAQTKEDLVHEGEVLTQQGNPLGAVVYFKNALDQDPNYVEARHQLALAYLKANKLEKAEKELQKVNLQDPQNEEALLDLASVYLALNKIDDAENSIQKVLARHEKSERSQEYLGLIAQSRGDLSLAGELFDEAIELDSESQSALLARIRLYLVQKHIGKAEELLHVALAKFPEQKQVYMILARVKARQGHLENALELFRKAIELDPNDVMARYWAGTFSLELGHVDQAQSYANDLLKMFPDSFAGSRLQGLIYYGKKDYKNAALALRDSLKTMKDPSGYYTLGLTEFQLKHYELALNQFQQVLDRQPQHVQARVMLSKTLLEQKRFDDCIYQITQVLAKNDGLAVAHSILGTAYLNRGDYDDATREFDKAITLDPSLADPHIKKGFLKLSRQNSSGAELELEKALEIAPEMLNTRLLLASLYLKQQKFQEVIDLLQGGLDGTTQDAMIYNYMGVAYLSQKNNEKGVETLQKAKELKSDYLASYFNLANYYLATQQNDKAVGEYNAVLKIDPENLKALIAIASLEEVKGNSQAALASYQRARMTNIPQGFLSLAGYLMRNHKVDAAIQVINEAFIAHPENASILDIRGRLMLQQKNFSEATKMFEILAKEHPDLGVPLLVGAWLISGKQDKAIALAKSQISESPKESEGYFLMAIIRQRLGQKSQAESVLLEGIDHVDAPRELSLQLGRFYVANGQMDKAQKIFTDLKQQYPGFSSAIYALGMLEEKYGNTENAEALYREVLAKSENHTGAMNNLAYLYAENNGDMEEALVLAMRAFRNAPANPVILDTLGLALMKNQRHNEAVSVLEKAVALLPSVAIVHLHYGEALKGNGNVDEAKKVLNYVVGLQSDPESRRAQQLLDQLKQ
ncbi:XrtA/PEP-CTERM system TPR-repeat protein PrsT [uncultured Desulfuromonas sp.]|uniref:XrtA/PEP-CTERM system TPR-repeat protein PrsT n=1 Tax=uncultured Desulfuromonas sp. TaxID=181013 RepID=UPI002AAB18B9|nr:XrtA/PEP-CTERM system TPR-repeat protein PrsT [uncultured Desulfuromonas sp.]